MTTLGPTQGIDVATLQTEDPLHREFVEVIKTQERVLL